MRVLASLAVLLLARRAAARPAPDGSLLLLAIAPLETQQLYWTLLERSLPPFTALDLGGTGCWPLSVHVAPGPHALLLEGARPTIERVRQKLGRGSPNTVSPMLDTWFKHLGTRIKDPGAFSAPGSTPDPVHQAAKHLWEVAQT